MKPSSLPLALSDAFEKYELYDPTTLSDADQAAARGVVGFGTMATFLLPIFEAGLLPDVFFSLLIGGGLGALVALRKDNVGTVARDVVGDTSNKAAKGAYKAAVEIERDLELTEKAKTSAKKFAEDLEKKIKEGL